MDQRGFDGVSPSLVVPITHLRGAYTTTQDEPQSAEQIHKRLAISCGENNVPALTTIQSTLSAKGSKLGIKIKESSKKVSYVRFQAEASAARFAVSAAEEQAGDQAKARPRLKARKERGMVGRPESVDSVQQEVQRLLARPFTAFALFGLAHHGVLKRQKSSAAVKEVVKAIGERWLLLSDTERRKYESMAEEDARRAAKEVASVPE